MLRFFIDVIAIPIVFLWRLTGWQVKGALPNIDKYVFVYAPHTSNWDYVHMIPLAIYFRRKPSTMVKKEATDHPLYGWFVKWVGGIAVDRSASGNVVQQAILYIQSQKRVVLVIAPEGTRRKTDHWKSGFYHIAQGASIPIVLGYLNYQDKTAGIGPAIYPTGDIEADFSQIRTFYEAHGIGLHPENASDIRFKISS